MRTQFIDVFVGILEADEINYAIAALKQRLDAGKGDPDRPWDFLGVSLRVANAIKDLNDRRATQGSSQILTCQQLAEFGAARFKRLPNVGRFSVDDVRAALLREGYILAP